MSVYKLVLILIAYWAFFFIMSVINYTYYNKVFNITIKFLPILQARLPNNVATFLAMFCDIIYYCCHWPLIALFYFSNHKVSCLYYFTVWVMANFLSSGLQLIYHAPRPFWVSKNVVAFECATDFGNPCTVIVHCCAFYFTVWLDYCKNCDHEDFDTLCFKCLYFLAFSFTVLSAGVARIVLGTNSILQVSFGAIIGIWLALLTHFVLSDLIKSHASGLLSGKHFNFKKYTTLAAIAMILLNLVTNLMFAFFDSNITIDAKWIANINRNNCETHVSF